MEHVPYTIGVGVGSQSVKISSVLLAIMKPIKVKQLTSSNNCRLRLMRLL